VVVDVALTAFVALGLLAFVSASRRAGFPRWEAGFGFAAAGAILVKGFVGAALLFLFTISFWAVSAARRRLRECVSPGALSIPVAVLLLWAGVVYSAWGRAGLSEAIWNQQFGRLLGLRHREYSHHRAPFYFYLLYLPGMLFPWIATFPYAVVRAVRDRAGRSMPARILPLLLGIAGALLFLSAAATKRTIYLLPLIPVAAVVIAGFLDSKLDEPPAKISRGLWIQYGAIAAMTVVILLLPAIGDRRVTLSEGTGILAALAACAALVPFARKSAPRLVASFLFVALASLLLLDQYSLPRWYQERAAKHLFARLERRLPPSTRLYSFEMNEDVLGWACLELSRAPLSESEPAGLLERLKAPDALVIAEARALSGAPDLKGRLEPVVRGRVESRPIALYRLRGSTAGGPAAAASLRGGAGAPSPGGAETLSRPPR